MPLSFDPSPEDLAQLAGHGIEVGEADRQLRCFRVGFPPVPLVRPATLGDGIEAVVLHTSGRLLDRWRAAAAAGRLSRFVPASGAASRMFSLLEQFRRGEKKSDAEIDSFFQAREQFPFFPRWSEACAKAGIDLASVEPGERRRAVDLLLGPEGLGLADLPKGLIPFHGERTAFAEQAAEALEVVADAQGVARIHFTVGPAFLDRIAANLGGMSGVDASFSVQHPSTDTLAADEEGRPFRDGQGRLVFRPGGHGALIRNLDDLDADIVLIKNIDNVATGPAREAALLADRELTGILLQRQEMAHGWWRRLENDVDALTLDEAALFVRSGLHRGIPEPVLGAEPHLRRDWLRDILARPLRVCGMVRNEGEPGGGPFWVRDAQGGESLQIVESSQIDPADSGQEAIFRASTHFNPVQLVCGLLGPDGQKPDLAALVDEEAGFVASKTWLGRPLQALERPGLWNGAMAGWNTIFVEVPSASFNPVKTVLDLLRPAHQA